MTDYYCTVCGSRAPQVDARPSLDPRYALVRCDHGRRDRDGLAIEPEVVAGVNSAARAFELMVARKARDGRRRLAYGGRPTKAQRAAMEQEARSKHPD